MCDRCDLLEEENRQLRRQMVGYWRAPSEIGLTRHQEIILMALQSTGRMLSKEYLITITRNEGSARKDDIEPKGMDVVICKLRERIRPFGLTIETIWGRGYRLTAESRERLLNWNDLPRSADLVAV